MLHKNCSFVNADCSAIAVKIRTKDKQKLWPSEKKNILLFSQKIVKDINKENLTLFDKEEDLIIKDDINRFDTQSINDTKYQWYGAVKPHYG